MGLQEIHHLVLQSCMSHRTLSEKKAHAIYARCVALCYGRDDEKPDFAQVMGDISHALEAYGFDIKKAQDEHTAKTWWSFVNTKSDELSKVATEYGPQEISYFRTLIKLIAKSGRKYAVAHKDAVRAGESKSVQPDLKATQAGAVLATFVTRGWLVQLTMGSGRNAKEMYQLSTRSKVELEDYLSKEYPVRCGKHFNCSMCRELVTKGVQCDTAGCKARMHEHCKRSYSQRHGRILCPTCKQQWVDDALVKIGPDAESGQEDEGDDDDDDVEQNEGDAAAQGNTSRRKSTRSGERGTAEDGEEQEEDNEEEQPQAGPSRRRASNATTNAKGKGKGRPSEMDTDGGAPSRRKDSTRARKSAESESEEEGRGQGEEDELAEEGAENEVEEDENEEDEEDDDDDPVMARRKAEARAEAMKKKAKRKAGQMS